MHAACNQHLDPADFLVSAAEVSKDFKFVCLLKCLSPLCPSRRFNYQLIQK